MGNNYTVKTQTKYETRLGRQASDYRELLITLTTIRRLSHYYTHFFALEKLNLDHPNGIPDSISIPMQAIAECIVLMYAKCFENSDRRLVSLQKEAVSTGDDSIKMVHNELLTVRNNYVAHAGNTHLHSYGMLIDISQGFPVIIDDPENYRTVSNPFVEIEFMEPLVSHLEKWINKKLEKLKLRLEDELNNIPAGLIIYRINNQQPITQQDIENNTP